MFFKILTHIFNFFKKKNNISYNPSLNNLLNLEKIYIENIKSYTNINFIQNKQSFIIDVHKKHFINITSHSYIIFPKQATQHILFIHGNLSGPSIWFETGAKLAEKGFIVHCISLPAFGGSIVSKKILDFTPIEILIFYSNFIAEYIICNIGKNNPPYIVTHSLGSYITTFFASQHPHLSKTITIVNGNIFGKNMFYWGLFFKSEILYFSKKIGYLINYLFFQYFHYKENTNLLHYINILEITSREIFGDLILSKLIHLDKYKLKMYISIFPYMISTINYPPISIIYGEDNFLPDFFKEQQKIIKIEGYSYCPMSHPDFSTYLLNAIDNSCKLIYLDKFNEIKEITDKIYVTYSLSNTIEIINNTYQNFLRL
jgi:hypothetical protein